MTSVWIPTVHSVDISK